jgi:phosphatidate cytidylyltransferase
MTLSFEVRAAVAVVAALLAIGAAGVVAWTLVTRRNPAAVARLPPRTAGARFASYALLAAILIIAVVLGLAGTAVALGVAATMAIDEWSRLFDLPRHHRLSLVVVAPLTITAAAVFGEGAAIVLLPVLVAAGFAWPVLASNTDRAMRDLGVAALGFVYVAVGLAHGVVLARDVAAGGALLIAVAVTTAISDVGAYLVGRRFGSSRLAPNLSPGKTRAGLVGNVLGGIAGVVLFAPAFAAAVGASGPLLAVWLVVAGMVLGLGAVWGDLFESAAKREAKVKDAGSWLPGFGGLLDRIDSLLVTIPLTYWLVRLVNLA